MWRTLQNWKPAKIGKGVNPLIKGAKPLVANMQSGDSSNTLSVDINSSFVCFYPLAQQSCEGDIGSVPYVCM